eukprot:12361806-Alexandrium_andersonii.AAC.1
MARSSTPPCAIRLYAPRALPAALSYEPALSLPGFNLTRLKHAHARALARTARSTRTRRAHALRTLTGRSMLHQASTQELC